MRSGGASGVCSRPVTMAGPANNPERSILVYRFGAFEADVRNAELRKHGFRLRLERKPWLLLLALLEADGHLVTRGELERRLWPEGLFVDFEHGLNVAVKKLRQTLNDSADEPRFIETVSREGYRFVAVFERVRAIETTAATLPAKAEELPVAPTSPAPIPRPGWARWMLPTFAAVGMALVIIVLLASNHIVHSEDAQPRLERLTSEHEVGTAAISPDGQYLAFTSAQAIWLKRIASGEVHRVALEQPLFPLGLSWLPDSATLLATNKEGVWRFSMVGGAPQRVLGPASFARASPDGHNLAVTSWDKRSISVTNANGGDEHVVARLPDGTEGFLSAPAWSPHGHRLAYMKHWAEGQRQQADIETVMPDGSDAKLVLRMWPIAHLNWLADGRLLFAVVKPPQGYRDLWAVEVNEATGQPAPARQITHWPDLSYWEPSTTADGRTVAFVRMLPRSDVYVADINGDSGPVSELRPVTSEASYSYSFPAAWDPIDGRLLLELQGDGKKNIVWQPRDGGPPRPAVPASDAAQYSPQITADGRWLLWVRESKGVAEILRMPRAGGPTEVLDRQTGQQFELRCPVRATRECILTSMQNRQAVFSAISPDSGASRELFRRAAGPGLNFAVSPEGDRILVCEAPPATPATSGNTGRVFTLDLPDGGNLRELPFPFNPNTMAWTWLLNGEGLLLTRVNLPGRGGTELLRIDGSGKAKVLWSSPSRLGEPLVSPDGHQIAFAQSQGERTVWLLRF